jgi:hypothetical protein
MSEFITTRSRAWNDLIRRIEQLEAAHNQPASRDASKTSVKPSEREAGRSLTVTTTSQVAGEPVESPDVSGQKREGA